MKKIIHNEYHKSINKAIDFINIHLKDTVDLKTLASIANISEFHFHRIFKAFIGESLGAYITRLRLERVAQKLQITKDTLGEIAEKTGYQTQYSLSKAFKNHFGITPSAFRNIETYFSTQSTKMKYEPMQFKPKINENQKKELVYIRIIAKYGSKKDYKIAWKKLWEFAKKNEILNHKNEFIGLSFDDPNITKYEKCRFYACISTNKQINPNGEFGLQTIEKGKYATFTLKGNYSGLDRLYKAIYFDWLPNSSIRLRDSMPFEKYLNNPDKVTESDLLTEIHIPIK